MRPFNTAPIGARHGARAREG